MSKYVVISGREKYGPEITSYLDTFHAVSLFQISAWIAWTRDQFLEPKCKQVCTLQESDNVGWRVQSES